MKSIFSELNKPSGRTLNRTDRILLCALLVVYSIVAFLNLGTLNFPQSAWTAEPGRVVRIDLGQQRQVSKILVCGNIAEGTLTLTDDGGAVETYKQTYGDMFRWISIDVTFDTRYVELHVTEGRISFNEMALFDAEGARLDATVLADGDAALLLDEQKTVPDVPSYFNGMYFDELYHARTAYEIVRDTDLFLEARSSGREAAYSYVKQNGLTIYEWTHPQLGKVLIAGGVRLFGMTPFGWRFTGTLFGVLILWVLYVLAKRIFLRTDFALLTAGLFAVDCMHYTQTRIATIDVYALFFTLLMFLFMLDYIEINRTDAPFHKKLVPLGLAGLAFGLGASSKWTCFYSGAGLAVLFFGSFLMRCGDILEDRAASKKTRRAPINWITTLPIVFTIGAFIVLAAAKLSHASSGTLAVMKYNFAWYDLLLSKGFLIPFVLLTVLAIVSAVVFARRTKGKPLDLRPNEQVQTLALCCVFFIAIPALLYFASSYSFFLSEGRVELADQLKCLWDKQISMYHYHADLDATHQCQSMWYQWPLAEKSVWFYYGGLPDGRISNISSTGNPAVWYIGAFGAVFMLIEWIFHAKYRKNKGLWVIWVAIAAGLLPWAMVTRCVFLYHYFSTLPFALLAAVALLYYAVQNHPQLQKMMWVWLGLAAALFVLMYPAISGLPCSTGYAGFIEHVLAVFGKVYYVGV